MDLRNFITFVVSQNGQRIGRVQRLVEFGQVTGVIDGVESFDSVRLITDQGRPGLLTEATHGPVSIRVRFKDGTKKMFAIADRVTVANMAFDRAASRSDSVGV